MRSWVLAGRAASDHQVEIRGWPLEFRAEDANLGVARTKLALI